MGRQSKRCVWWEGEEPYDELTVQDGFAGLRTEAAGLLPAYALLPQNIISETQALRDNALIAAEIEEALEPVQQNPVEVKKQYLNDAGSVDFTPGSL